MSWRRTAGYALVAPPEGRDEPMLPTTTRLKVGMIVTTLFDSTKRCSCAARTGLLMILRFHRGIAADNYVARAATSQARNSSVSSSDLA